jgi:hypothetical protein
VIFSNPRKAKTQAFIHNIRTYHYEVASRDFDYAEMLGGVENFCFRHAIGKKTANKLLLLAEELVIHIVAPIYGSCSLNMSYSDKLGTYELSVSYGGEKADALATTENDLSALIARSSAKEIRHYYAEGKNTLTATL